MAITPRNEQERSAVQQQEAPRKRFHFGVPQAKLQPACELDPAFHYHWINDIPGRVEMALASGYQFVVKTEITLTPGVVPRDSDPGSHVSAIVGSQEGGDPLRAYLMKIPLELYEESQGIIQQRIDRVDEAIRQGKTSGQEDKNFYVPKGSPIRMGTKLDSKD